MSTYMPREASVTDEGGLALHEGPGFLSWVAGLVHAHRDRLLAYARRRGLDAEDSLDAVQDSFVSFLRLPEARAIAHASEDSLKLLTVILRHNLQNRRRKHARHGRAQLLLEAEAAHIDRENSETLIAQAEELARVAGCIRRMAQVQRRVVMLSLLDGQSRDEVAKVLGISEGYVRVLLHRARQHVRNCPVVEEGTVDGDGV
jgi:RNA polymerase sigma-70 factor (ECF subfamily)